MTIGDRWRRVVTDGTQRPGREVIADRTRTTCRRPLRRSGFRAGNAVPRRQCTPASIETERGVVTTQISELGRAQRPRQTVAPVSDWAAVTTVEPGCEDRAYAAGGVRLARLQRGVLRRAGSSTSSGCGIGWQAGVGEEGLANGERDLAANLSHMRLAPARSVGPSERTSPALMLALSFSDRGGFWGA